MGLFIIFENDVHIIVFVYCMCVGGVLNQVLWSVLTTNSSMDNPIFVARDHVRAHKTV